MCLLKNYPVLLCAGAYNPSPSAASLSSEALAGIPASFSTSHSTSPGTRGYSVFSTCPASLYLSADSFLFLTCPSPSFFWGLLSPLGPARCHPLWSRHLDHPGPNSFLWHVSSLCILFMAPYRSLPMVLSAVALLFAGLLACPHHLFSYAASERKLLESCQWALLVFVHPMAAGTTHDTETKLVCGIKERKTCVSLASSVTRVQNKISCRTGERTQAYTVGRAALVHPFPGKKTIKQNTLNIYYMPVLCKMFLSELQ